MNPQQPSNVDRERSPLPSDEATIRRPMRVPAMPPPTERPYRTDGLKGGPKIDRTAADRLNEPPETARADESQSAFYGIAAKDVDQLETPVFRAGEGGSEEAVALFTTQQDAQLYIHAAGWDKSHEVRPIGPALLNEWLKEAQTAGVEYVALNLDATQLKTGAPQPVLALADLPDRDVAEWVLEQASLVRGRS
jgi:hypothetical protein